MRSVSPKGKSAHYVIPRNGSLMLVYVEPHITVTTSGNYNYVFGGGTKLKVLPSEYYRQDRLYFISHWCLRGKVRGNSFIN